MVQLSVAGLAPALTALHVRSRKHGEHGASCVPTGILLLLPSTLARSALQKGRLIDPSARKATFSTTGHVEACESRTQGLKGDEGGIKNDCFAFTGTQPESPEIQDLNGSIAILEIWPESGGINDKNHVEGR